MVQKLKVGKLAAEALKAFRKSRGFRSATAAAEFYGWPASRYRSHESGARPILKVDAKRYAAAFGARLEELLNPDPTFVGTQANWVRDQRFARRRDTALRLRCARILAGYDSAAKACRAWDLAHSTYVKHESADNAVSEAATKLYGAIFGVEAEWLRAGTLPSGLGPEIDAKIQEALRSPLKFQSLRRLRSPPHPEYVAELKDRLQTSRGGQPNFTIPEYIWDEIESARGNTNDLERRETWSVPASLILEREAHKDELFVVISWTDREGVVARERLFVLRDSFIKDEADYLVYVNGSLRITKSPSRTDQQDRTLGRIIGRLRGAPPGGSAS
jgi:hypothetical protein